MEVHKLRYKSANPDAPCDSLKFGQFYFDYSQVLSRFRDLWCEQYGSLDSGPKARIFIPDYTAEADIIYFSWYGPIEPDIVDIYEKLLGDGWRLSEVVHSQFYSFLSGKKELHHQIYENYREAIKQDDDSSILLQACCPFFVYNRTETRDVYTGRVFGYMRGNTNTHIAAKLFSQTLYNAPRMLLINDLDIIPQFPLCESALESIQKLASRITSSDVEIKNVTMNPMGDSTSLDLVIRTSTMKNNPWLADLVFLIVSFQIPMMKPWREGLGCVRFGKSFFNTINL